MLTTAKMSLNNNSFTSTNDHSRSNIIQLPPLSHLLNHEYSSSAPSSTTKVPTITTTTTGTNSAPISPTSTTSSRLPSITDMMSPNQSKTPVKEKSSEKKAYAFISHSPATFPSHEPSIDNAQLARRKRRRTSPNELSILQNEFELGHTPNKARRQEIAAKVNMTEKAVQIWFQNKRQALRKLQLNDHSIHQTTTITLPEVDAITSPIRSTPTKYYENSNANNSFSTSPISSTSSTQELPTVMPSTAPDLRSSPPPPQQQQQPLLHQLPPPRTATWTMMTPASNSKLTPVTPIRNHQQISHNQQLPTPNIMSFRLNKKESKNSSFTNFLPTPASSGKFTQVPQKPFMKVAPLDTSIRSPSPLDSKVKTMMSLTNLNSPAVPTESKKRNALGDITNTQNITSSKTENKKKPGEAECVEHLLALRTANWK